MGQPRADMGIRPVEEEPEQQGGPAFPGLPPSFCVHGAFLFCYLAFYAIMERHKNHASVQKGMRCLPFKSRTPSIRHYSNSCWKAAFSRQAALRWKNAILTQGWLRRPVTHVLCSWKKSAFEHTLFTGST